LTKIEVDLDGAGSVGANKITYNGLVTDVAINETPGEVATENVTVSLGGFGFSTVY